MKPIARQPIPFARISLLIPCFKKSVPKSLSDEETSLFVDSSAYLSSQYAYSVLPGFLSRFYSIPWYLKQVQKAIVYTLFKDKAACPIPRNTKAAYPVNKGKNILLAYWDNKVQLYVFTTEPCLPPN